MKIEVVEKPSRLGKSNIHWLNCLEQYHRLGVTESLRITGLNKTDIGALRQQAYREQKARSFVRIENGEPVLYLHKPRKECRDKC